MNLHRLLFAAGLIFWTWLLVKPKPIPEFMTESLLEDVKFILGKCLHFGVYAFLAWYGTFRVREPVWKWIWIGLVLHGVATELAQHYGHIYFQTQRTGTFRDVIIDAFGVAFGAWLMRRAFTSSLKPIS